MIKLPKILIRNFTTKYFNKITHGIFDLDGLILNSQVIYDKIISDILQQHGKTYTIETKRKITALGEDELARTILEDFKIPMKAEDFIQDFRARVRIELQHPEFMPGAATLIKHLHQHKVPIAVATSSIREEMTMKTKDHMSIFKLFDNIVCGSDPEVKKSKPAPDIFLAAAAKFPDKPDPSKCLVFEDAPNGVKAAAAAGMQCVWVTSGQVLEETKNMATLIIPSLTEFKPELFGLPPFQ